MRTSRISRDTARIVAATRTQRTLRQSRTAQNVASKDGSRDGTRRGQSEANDGNAASDSEFSAAPVDSSSDGETKPSSRKRKRGQQTPILVKQESKETCIAAIAPPRPRKARRVPAKKIRGPDGSIKIEPPPNWEEMYSLTRVMRNENVAPVDTMGCESLADRSQSPRDQRFQTLISLMLSSQTKDTVTAVAIKGMQDRMPGGFNLESVLALEPTVLNGFINKVGFHNQKTKFIKQTAEILRDKWNSDIPDTIEGLVSLPGVGPKMGYLTLSAAWGRDEGIGVDVHVHRITNLWGWNKTQQPEQTRAMLESWLPRDRWHDINNLLVGFGQTICLPVGRKCGECRLADRGLCPSAAVARSTTVKKESTLVKAEVPDSKTLPHDQPIAAEVEKIKVEAMEVSIADIEDIGRMPGKRTPRRQ